MNRRDLQHHRDRVCDGEIMTMAYQRNDRAILKLDAIIPPPGVRLGLVQLAARQTIGVAAGFRRWGIQLVLALSSILRVNSLAGAEDSFPDPIPDVKTYEWMLSPQSGSSPALKYRLYPPLVDTVAGNAAAHYFRAILLVPRALPEQLQKEADWSESHAVDLPLDDVKKWLGDRQVVIDEITAATRCDSCDWGIRLQDLRGRDVIYNRLPEFQEMRQLSRILNLKAQVEIAEHRFDDAIATLRMSYRMATDVAKSPSIIVNLISTVIVSVANETTGELIATKNAPNLYWALRTLPDPLIDRLAIAQLDVGIALQLFPFLKDAETVQRSPEEWQRLLTGLVHETRSLTRSSPSAEVGDAVDQISATVLIMRCYPVAKRELIAQGMNSAVVEGMPVGQVVAIYVRNCYRHVAQEFEKWASLPYLEGESRLRKLLPQLQQEGYFSTSPTFIATRDPLLINQALFPSFMVGEAFNRPRRMIACLATIEAIRMHAAAHQNSLPTKLDDITVVPVPVDPGTGKPFLYRVVDGRAEILAPPTLPGIEHSGRRFLLRLR